MISNTNQPERRLRAIIVDDEDLARSILREYLATHSDVEVVAECVNGFEAVKGVAELHPDVLFLDVQMPKLNGFEVVDLIDEDIAVVFVTAFDEYALKAFEIHAADYLLKPFSEDRLALALEHAKEQLASGTTKGMKHLAEESLVHGGPVDRLIIRDGSRVEIVPTDKVEYIEAQDDYVMVMSAGKKLLKKTTMNTIETILDPRRFVRIHRSYLLNIEQLVKLELYAKDSRVAILKNGTRLAISRSGYNRLKDLL